MKLYDVTRKSDEIHKRLLYKNSFIKEDFFHIKTRRPIFITSACTYIIYRVIKCSSAIKFDLQGSTVALKNLL